MCIQLLQNAYEEVRSLSCILTERKAIILNVNFLLVVRLRMEFHMV